MKSKVTVWTKPAPIKVNGVMVHPDPVLASPQPVVEIEGSPTKDETRSALRAQLQRQGHTVLTISVNTDMEFVVYIADDDGPRKPRSARSRTSR